MPEPNPLDRSLHKPAARPAAAGDVQGDVQDDAVIGRAFRWSLGVIAALLACGGAVWAALALAPGEAVVEQADLDVAGVRALPERTPPTVPLVEVTDAAGIDFVHENGAAGEKLLPETMGGGGGFFDFDADGDPDLLLVNSARWPWDARASGGESGGDPAVTRLYENDGAGNFADVTAGSGLGVTLYGMGCAFGDYDADGDPDVYLTAVGTNKLFRNDGGGRFADVTAELNVAGPADAWTTAAGWFDADADGDLDLLAVNYIQWSREYDAAQPFTLTGDERGYGRPAAFAGTVPLLFRNDGGTFTEAAGEAGLHVLNGATGDPLAKSLGLTFADADADGDLDVFVANDTVRNFLFFNRAADGEPGRFVESGTAAGVAFDESGEARGAMGVDAARFRGDADLAFAVGNFSTEMTALYAAPVGAGAFTDEAVANGLGPQTRLALTFGVLFTDADLDGRPDLLCANGHLEEGVNRVQSAIFYEQPPQLFWNAGPDAATEFVPFGPDQLGEDFFVPLVARAALAADVDLDGDEDYLLTTLAGRPRLFRNDRAGNNSLRVTVAGAGNNTAAVGAAVTVTAGGRAQTKLVNPTRGYLSQTELPLTFGLGENETVTVRVVWPDGVERTLDAVPAGAVTVGRP